jgi:hypothetical protein
VLDTLVQLRRQRPGMVQTKEQLILRFDAADHQLLTNRGFMFADDVLAAVRWRRDSVHFARQLGVEQGRRFAASDLCILMKDLDAQSIEVTESKLTPPQTTPAPNSTRKTHFFGFF